MHPPQSNKDYDVSPPPCADLDYLDIQTQPGEIRYNPDANASSLAIEPPQPSPLLNLFHHPSSLNTNSPYSQDGAAFYQSASHVYSGVDVRARLNSKISSAYWPSSTAPSSGMAHVHPHTHRTVGLPHPGPQISTISTRDQYAPSTPSFRRAAEHTSRSPSFPGATLRHHPMSTTPSPLTGFAAPAGRMDSNHYGSRNGQNSVPPLGPTQSLGSLQYADGTATTPTDIKVEISGTVDKGFFISPEGEWTCYRRNYLACVCSFTLTPHYIGVPVQFTPAGSAQVLQVYGFAMCISAVVADNDQHSIELIQHTPKRDKGPTSKPEKIIMGPKPNPIGHHGMNIYADGSAAPRGLYSDGGFTGSQQANGLHLTTEHTFERIQFKQATQNNGKRRAAQQYYHLTVELWADVGTQQSDQYIKVAIRKSAKMIVRGRSPGHYQNERRSSQNGGPGGAAGGLGYPALGGMGDFSNGGLMGGYSNGYDTRGSVYGMRQHDVASDSMAAEDEKPMDHVKACQYYAGSMYEVSMDKPDAFPSRAPHQVKHEHEMGALPRLFHPHQARPRTQRGSSDEKSSPRGCYGPISI